MSTLTGGLSTKISLYRSPARNNGAFYPPASGMSSAAVAPSSCVVSGKTRNCIFDNLSPAAHARLAPHVRQVHLPTHKMLYNADDRISYVYFPHDTLISNVTMLEDGTTVETGLIGYEGMTGLGALLDGEEQRALSQSVVQIGGTATRLPLALVRAEFNRGGEFHSMILEYMRLAFMQLRQGYISNVRQTIEQRLSRWLLMAQDRIPGTILLVTHDTIAQMLGTRRPSVTVAARLLQEKNCLRYARGRVTITDRRKLEEFAGECYAQVKTEFYRYVQQAVVH